MKNRKQSGWGWGTYHNWQVWMGYTNRKGKCDEWADEIESSMPPTPVFGMDDINMDELENYKPGIERSMEFIEGIVYNATGKTPTLKEYYYEDGGPLNYPEVSGIVHFSVSPNRKP